MTRAIGTHARAVHPRQWCQRSAPGEFLPHAFTDFTFKLLVVYDLCLTKRIVLRRGGLRHGRDIGAPDLDPGVAPLLGLFRAVRGAGGAPTHPRLRHTFCEACLRKILAPLLAARDAKVSTRPCVPEVHTFGTLCCPQAGWDVICRGWCARAAASPASPRAAGRRPCRPTTPCSADGAPYLSTHD